MRNTPEPDELLGHDDADEARAASLPPQPGEDVHARATRPIGADVFARVTMPTPAALDARPTVPVAADAHVRPTVPGAAEPILRPTVPGVYPDAAGEAAMREVHERKTVVDDRRPRSERPARPTEPIAASFAAPMPLPFPRAAETSRSSLSPVATSASRPRWSASSSDTLPAASRRRPLVAMAAVGVAIAIGCTAALIGRAMHRPEASAAPPPSLSVALPPPAMTATAAPEPASTAPSAAATAPTATAIVPRAKPNPTSPSAPQPAATASPSARAPHRVFDVEKD